MSTSTPKARPATEVRDARKDEDHQVADLLARAFWDDPVLSWLMPDPVSRYARMRHFFRAELHTVRPRGLVLTTHDVAGAALWSAPDKWKTPPLDIVKDSWSMIRAFGTMIPKALPLLGRMEKVHPTESHWYLAVIGTDPVRQGRGAGAALITDVTDRCDDAGLPAYLESSNDVNVPYYERFGFRVTEAISIPAGPTMRCMWRDPR